MPSADYLRYMKLSEMHPDPNHMGNVQAETFSCRVPSLLAALSPTFCVTFFLEWRKGRQTKGTKNEMREKPSSRRRLHKTPLCIEGEWDVRGRSGEGGVGGGGETTGRGVDAEAGRTSHLRVLILTAAK